MTDERPDVPPQLLANIGALVERTGLQPRAAVALALFIARMSARLSEKIESKGDDWLPQHVLTGPEGAAEYRCELLRALTDYAGELQQHQAALLQAVTFDGPTADVQREAADVANMAMMLADIYQALRDL